MTQHLLHNNVDRWTRLVRPLLYDTFAHSVRFVLLEFADSTIN